MSADQDKLEKLYIKYQQAIADCNVNDIAENGERYYHFLRDGEPTPDDKEKMQNEMLEAKTWLIKPL